MVLFILSDLAPMVLFILSDLVHGFVNFEFFFIVDMVPLATKLLSMSSMRLMMTLL